MIGTRIGHFEIVARAGRGGMGEVFVAEHTGIQTRVAIKMLHADVSQNADHVQRFFNEARAVARIRHAGIAKIFDVGHHSDGRAYLIMEYLEGESLAARAKRLGRLSPRATAEIARQIASILDATQQAGIIHRDLKPDNVFVVPDHELESGERVKVLDFGIAKLTDTLTAAKPTTNATMGTPAYMAPEQWGNTGGVDWRADAYSLGCIAYELAAGRPPFAVTSMADACAKHLHEVPASIRAYVPDTPVALDALVLRLLAKDPSLRAESFGAIERRFAELVEAAPGSFEDLAATYPSANPTELPLTTLGGAATPSVVPAERRRRWLGAGAAAAAIAIGAVVVWRVRAGGRDAEVPRAEPPPRSAAPQEAAPGSAGQPPAAPSLADRIAAVNPFVPWHGRAWLAHQVTRGEYRWFLESLSVAEALRHQPLGGWDDREPDRAVGWITHERATAFCRAIGAALPTSDEWTAASEGGWGIDPTGAGRPGPLQEWTQTVRDGLAIVRGGHARMAPDQRRDAAREPLMKSTEALAGPGAPANVVAAEMIGVRCVR